LVKKCECCIDNVFVDFIERVFQQAVGDPMGTNSAILLANLFFLSFQESKKKKTKND
jgi:hypothetical protein